MATTTLGPTGALQYFTVPEDVSVLQVVLGGAAGVAVTSYELNAGVALPGGNGARLTCRLPVTAGEQLWLAVGGIGRPDGASTNGSTIAGGGDAGGGAATILGRGPVDLEHAVLIAGGGGGGGEDGTGGAGGGIGGRSAGTGGGGLGGGQDPTWTSPSGESTTLDGCGGGGGGLVGGRAGAVADSKRGGGGGGSSRFTSGATLASDVTGAGFATLSWALAPFAPETVAPAPGEVVSAGRQVALRWRHRGAHSDDAQVGATVTFTSPAGSFNRSVTGAAQELLVDPSIVQVGPFSWTVATRSLGSPDGPSTGSSFSAAPAPADPAFTAPAEGAVLTATTCPVTWSATEQVAFRLQVTSTDGARVDHDTGWVADPGARSALVPLPASGRSLTLRLQVRASSGATSSVVLRRVATRWVRPATPLVVVTPEPALAALRVRVTHPVQDGRPAARTATAEVIPLVQAGVPEGGAGGSESRHPVALEGQPDGSLLWRLPAHGRQYLVAITAYDALGVPATGVSAPPDGVAGGWGVGPWATGPWGV